jgi:hypothetical protein
MTVAVLVLASMAILSSVMVATCLAQDATAVKKAHEEVTTQPEGQITLKLVYEELMVTQKLAKWAAVLSGLALVGALWVGWSLKTVAKNEIELAQLIAAIKEK